MRVYAGTTSELPLIGITNHQNYQFLELLPINAGNRNAGNSEVFDQNFYFLMVPYRNFHSYHLTLTLTLTLTHTLNQGWPTQLHHWANISAPILKRAAKLLLMTNSHYFTSFSSNFFDELCFENLIFPAIPAKSLSPKIFPTSQQN